MSDKQQTAVEWFIEQLEEKGDLRETPSIMNIQLNIDTTEYLDLKRQAKEMEKEQNKNYLKEYFEWHKSMGFVSHKPEDIIEFNETYGEK
jgi:hypothetical protein